jgi:hypothetical protein
VITYHLGSEDLGSLQVGSKVFLSFRLRLETCIAFGLISVRLIIIILLFTKVIRLIFYMCQAAGIAVALVCRADLRMPSVACSTAIAEVSPRSSVYT